MTNQIDTTEYRITVTNESHTFFVTRIGKEEARTIRDELLRRFPNATTCIEQAA